MHSSISPVFSSSRIWFQSLPIKCIHTFFLQNSNVCDYHLNNFTRSPSGFPTKLSVRQTFKSNVWKAFHVTPDLGAGSGSVKLKIRHFIHSLSLIFFEFHIPPCIQSSHLAVSQPWLFNFTWILMHVCRLVPGRSIISKKADGSQVKESTDSSSTTIEDDDVKGKPVNFSLSLPISESSTPCSIWWNCKKCTLKTIMN